MNRRKYLAISGGMIAIAGCTGETNDDPPEEEEENNDPASFEINNISSSDNDIREGSSVTLKAEIENTGDESGETTIDLNINDHQESELVSLEGGEESTVEFEIDTAEISSGRHGYTFSVRV